MKMLIKFHAAGGNTNVAQNTHNNFPCNKDCSGSLEPMLPGRRKIIRSKVKTDNNRNLGSPLTKMALVRPGLGLS